MENFVTLLSSDQRKFGNFTPDQKQSFFDSQLLTFSNYRDTGLISKWSQASEYFEIRYILKYSHSIKQEVIPLSEIEIKNVSGKVLDSVKLRVITNDWLGLERRNFIDVGDMGISQKLGFALVNVPLLNVHIVNNELRPSHGSLNLVLDSLGEEKLDLKILSTIIPSSFGIANF